MNIIFSKTRHLARARTLLKYSPLVRGAALFDADWQPGPYPKNEQERRAAAKKYNLLPEEYEPLDPKWDIGQGDYPYLPNRCYDDEDPYGNCEYMADLRHFGEPIHPLWEVLQSNGVTLNFDSESLTFKDYILVHLIAIVFTFWYCKFVREFKFISNYKPKHMPLEGEGVHYHYPTSDLSHYESHHH